MPRLHHRLLGVLLVLAIAGCGPQSAPAAKPTAPAATTAPAAAPSAAASPATAPSAPPAPSPSVAAVASAQPVASPAAVAPTFNEQAVADFYRGKTVRIIVGFAPGGGYDTAARLIAKYLPNYLPGSPTVIVENRPGAGGIVAANTIYATEPKDGTVISAFVEQAALLQFVGADGIAFDVTKMNWLGSLAKSTGVCYVRTDAGVDNLQQLISTHKELNTPTPGRGTGSHTIPAVLNLALGTNFKLVPGYASYPETKLAFQKNEGEVLCSTSDVMIGRDGDLFEGPTPTGKVLLHFGGNSPDLQNPLLKDVPNVETLATTDEARQLIRAVNAPFQMYRPYAVAPEVPADRVAALSVALQKIFADPQFAADAKGPLSFTPAGVSTGEQVTQTVNQLGQIPPEIRAKLKDIL